jgi:hypothetical protein
MTKKIKNRALMRRKVFIFNGGKMGNIGTADT